MSGREIAYSLALVCSVLMLVSHPAVADDGALAIKVLDRMLTALGGRDALMEVRSLSVEAECTGPDGDFQTTVKSLRLGRAYFHQTSDRGNAEIWSTPEATWMPDESGGFKTLDPGVRNLVRNHEFHLLVFDIVTRFTDHSVTSTDSIDGHSCVKVTMMDLEGNPASLWVDTESAFPVMLEMNPPGAQGSLRIQFSDWDEVESVQYFKSFVLSEGPDRHFTYEYVTIKPNTVPKDLFDVPEGIEVGEKGVTPSPSRK